jgi:hypothetical protein
MGNGRPPVLNAIEPTVLGATGKEIGARQRSPIAWAALCTSGGWVRYRQFGSGSSLGGFTGAGAF